MTAMQPDSLDILEKAHVPHEQARAFVSTMKVEIGLATEILATKHDIELVRHEMTEMRQGLELKIEGVRASLEAKIEGVRGNLETKIEAVRGSLETKSEGMRGGLETKIEGLRTEMHRSASSIILQMYVAIFGAMTFLMGLAYFFVTHLKN